MKPSVLLARLAIVFVAASSMPAASQDKVQTVDGKTFEEWHKVLRTGTSVTRAVAMGALGKFGAAAKPAVPDLLTVFREASDSLRANAEAALLGIGPDAVPGLIGGLKSPYHAIRQGSASTLAHFGNVEGVVPALVETLADPRSGARVHAAVALGRIGPGNPANLAALRAALKDKDGLVRVASARALGNFGRHLQEVVPDLVAMRPLTQPHTRNAAREAVGRLGEGAVPILIGFLKDPDAELRATAADLLDPFGPKAAEAVPARSAGLASMTATVAATTVTGVARPVAMSAKSSTG